MLKIFLVEDEYVVREGIKNNIDWTAAGYEFCGEASDGELAYPLISKLRPDIVITDIKMPFMDGLELSKKIKTDFPKIEIIIISGYEEFEYAQKGIKIGVAEYLTKPISGKDLLAGVNTLAEKIKVKQKEYDIQEKYLREMEENSLEEKRNLFHKLVSCMTPYSEIRELAEKLNIDLSAQKYSILLLAIQSLEHTNEEYSDRVVEIEQKLSDINFENHILVIDRNLEGKAILIKADSQEKITEMQNHYLQQMKAVLDTYNHIRYFIAVGTSVDGLNELPEAFAKASRVFARRYLVGDSMIAYEEQQEERKSERQQAFDISNVDPKMMNRQKIRDFLARGEKDEVAYFVEEFFHGFGNTAIDSVIFRQYIAMDTYFCVAEFLESISCPTQEIESHDLSCGLSQSMEEIIIYIKHIIEKAIELRTSAASNHYSDVVEEIKQYIDINYANEDLSLNTLASHVNFSPNHLSMIFSQQTGQTFIKYLTDYRMNKAKELLRCTGKPHSEVCCEVGYKDQHYFSYLFKKTQGMTPTQYRGGRHREGEEV